MTPNRQKSPVDIQMCLRHIDVSYTSKRFRDIWTLGLGSLEGKPNPDPNPNWGSSNPNQGSSQGQMRAVELINPNPTLQRPHTGTLTPNLPSQLNGVTNLPHDHQLRPKYQQHCSSPTIRPGQSTFNSLNLTLTKWPMKGTSPTSVRDPPSHGTPPL